jgi:hypothetical protein
VSRLFQQLAAGATNDLERAAAKDLATIEQKFNQELERHGGYRAKMWAETLRDDIAELDNRSENDRSLRQQMRLQATARPRDIRLTDEQLRKLRARITTSSPLSNAILLERYDVGEHDDSTPVLRTSAESFTDFKVNRIRFKCLQLSPDQPFDVTKPHLLQDTLFELRSDKKLFNCEDHADGFAGVIDNLISHTTLSPDGTIQHVQKYLFVRLFERYEGRDPYGYSAQ